MVSQIGFDGRGNLGFHYLKINAPFFTLSPHIASIECNKANCEGFVENIHQNTFILLFENDFFVFSRNSGFVNYLRRNQYIPYVAISYFGSFTY